MAMARQTEWLAKLNDTLPLYLATLQVPNQRGRFLPCAQGATEVGKRVALGFSCFALKIYYTLGLWERLPSDEQEAWIVFLKSFQVDGKWGSDGITHNAFIDPSAIRYLAGQVTWRRRLIERFFPPRRLTPLQRAIIAETKQAIATLVQVGERPTRPFRGFPTTPAGVRMHLLRLDWTKPWGAGGQASALPVFLKTQSAGFLQHEPRELLDVCSQFFESLADPETGAYFKGSTPEHGQLINGAMKVLTALDWLEVPVHHPERLIDACLERLPSSDGCHLVDAVYVLYRCSQQTQHSRARIQAYCSQVLDMIKQHFNADGGFSYYIGRSQTSYYGVPISRGLAESDIHATFLLSWAIAMIAGIRNNGSLEWRVIRP